MTPSLNGVLWGIERLICISMILVSEAQQKLIFKLLSFAEITSDLRDHHAHM